MKQDWYTFPAIFHFADDGISVEFPDLPGCLTCGNNEEHAFQMAKEVMGLHLYGMEKDGLEIPKPTNIRSIELDSNEVWTLIQVFMPAFRDDMEQKAVKKTLTIPKWLDDLAVENGVNFSRVLQEGLKKYLGV